jgi:hypothetical protein
MEPTLTSRALALSTILPSVLILAQPREEPDLYANMAFSAQYKDLLGESPADLEYQCHVLCNSARNYGCNALDHCAYQGVKDIVVQPHHTLSSGISAARIGVRH